MFRILTLSSLLLAAFAVSAFAQKEKDKEKPKAPVYKTPQECFDAGSAAEVKGDFKTLVGCLAPVAQKDLAAMFAVEFSATRAELSASKEEQAQTILKLFKPIFDVLDKHGLTEKATKEIKKSKDAKEMEKSKKAALALIKNPVAFDVDLFTALDKLNPKEKDKGKDKLTGLKIDGDKATGTIVSTTKGKDGKEKEKKEPVQFVKINGSWRMIPEFAPEK